jgi:5-oxopent-3-ene-1,2,5-tricarboxylate decarboxylase/2-hydroxyhepta-2,4-diene-1,7-dioate isomerase
MFPLEKEPMKLATLQPPITGTLYSPVLNDRPSLDRLGTALDEAPYKAPPKAPALFIKPRNTYVASGATVTLPTGATALAVAGQLGLVIGRAASRVDRAEALEYVAGYLPVIDLSIPHASVYRPAIREKCFDGACPMAAQVADRASIGVPSRLTIATYVDGKLVAERTLDDLLRPAALLLADVTEFMTLVAGDVLLLGAPLDVPQALPGQRVRVEIAEVGSVECVLQGSRP